MDLYKCAECVLRQARPIYASRQAKRMLPRGQADTLRPNSLTMAPRYRGFSSSAQRLADDDGSTDSVATTRQSNLDALKSIFNNPSSGRSTLKTPSATDTVARSEASASSTFTNSFLNDLFATSNNTLLEPERPPLELVPAPFRLDPTLGRTVRVNSENGVDVGAAFRNLQRLCTQNKIKRDFMSQRFHERPGLKRKRLKSQRHRLRFKTAFQETVRRVQKMRRMGY